MPNTPHTALSFDVYLWNEDDPAEPIHHEVVTGLRERMRAKAKFKKPIGEVLESGDEEGIAFLAYLGCQRYGHIAADLSFDDFIEQVFAVDVEGIEEAQEAAKAAAAGGLTSDETPAKEEPNGGRDD